MGDVYVLAKAIVTTLEERVEMYEEYCMRKADQADALRIRLEEVHRSAVWARTETDEWKRQLALAREVLALEPVPVRNKEVL